jgi:acetyl-CoA carboxylase biotin carboxyl carrier protein
MAEDNNSIEKELILELASLLTETGLTEIEIEKKGLRLRVARGVAPNTTMMMAPSAPASAPMLPAALAATDRAAAAEHPGTVKSPMVGTAFRSPEPGAAAFIELGSKVTAGQTLLIIEAMKTMNQIPAPRAGTVTALFVQNGQPVEYGEPLVVIE